LTIGLNFKIYHIKKTNLLFFLLLFFIQFFFIILYELNFLTLIIGYSDWDLYKKVLLYGYNRDGFIAILNSLHNIIGSTALYIWYVTQILVNSFLLSKLLSIL
jgi:hypothetical protein